MRWEMDAHACVRVCSYLSRRPLKEIKERPDERSALWCLLTLSTWTFFHEMGTGCACVRARVHVCGHCIALIRRLLSQTQNVLFLS